MVAQKTKKDKETNHEKQGNNLPLLNPFMTEAIIILVSI